MATEAEIQKRIAEEQAKIKVPSYQDVALDGAWKRRSSAIWGISIVGMMMGTMVGLAAPILPAIAASLPITALLVAKSVAIFSAIGITAGWGVGAVLGSSSGAAASTMKEFERRQLARGIEQTIRDNPDATVTLGENAIEQESTDIGVSRYFNWKAGLTFAALGALGGMVFAAALTLSGGVGAAIPLFAMPAMNLLLGESVTATAAIVYTVGLGSLSGALFGINGPLFARKAANFFGDLLSGKAIGAPWPDSANLPDLKPILSPVVTKPEPLVEIPVEGKHCAACAKDKPQFKGYKDLVSRSIAEANIAR